MRSDLAELRVADLEPSQFNARYGCDRFTAAVLASRLRYIVDHTVDALHRVAFSPVLRMGDMAAAFCGPAELGYAMPAVSRTLPYFVGSIPDAVRLATEEYGYSRLNEGDILMVNDPYRVGTHVNDVCFIRPTFIDEALIGFVVLRCHMLDWGGQTAGGFDVAKTSTFVDGLTFPPTLLYDCGEPVPAVFAMLHRNTRFAALVVPDILAIKASLDTGAGLLCESVDKYGPDAIVGAVRYACDASWESMASALRQLPDGTYEGEDLLDTDALPDSPPYRVKVTIHKVGDRVEVDFSGSSVAARSALNGAWPDAKTATAFALVCLLDPGASFTSASLRGVDILLPPDSIVNPSPPHSCFYYFDIQQVSMMAIYAALNPALGERAVAHDGGANGHIVNGRTETGDEWWCGRATSSHSPWGGSAVADGESQQMNMFTNIPAASIEEEEGTGPFVSLGLDVIVDSGGPGAHRGGCARTHDTYWFAEADHRAFHFHVTRAPAGGGVYGASAGLLGGSWLWPGEEDRDVLGFLPEGVTGDAYAQSRVLYGIVNPDSGELDPDGDYVWAGFVQSGPGTIVRSISTGAGGWGDPLERNADLVCRDVRDGYVSVAGAERDYGVVIIGDPTTDPEGLRVDDAATVAARARRRSSSAHA